MNIVVSPEAKAQLIDLPERFRKKAQKQFSFLLVNHRHPSLRTKKMKGTGYFEGRIDYHYRFTFMIADQTVFIISIGPHDEGLGKK